MRVLWLGGPYQNEAILSYLRSIEERVTVGSGPLFLTELDGGVTLIASGVGPFEPAHDWVVSCNYKHVLSPRVCQEFAGRAINLHTSYLPWNRGSQPNYWSWRENTEKGVSIHQITPQLDRGPLYAQRRVQMRAECETLATSHARLQAELFALFTETWGRIRLGKADPVPQAAGGSYHSRADFAAVKHTLEPLMWNTPVSALVREKVAA